ncbi:MAG: urease accessory protein UreD [Myxococcales bacterium]|nr:urease accessory protein UreD [Myxococcales bacterium]
MTPGHGRLEVARVAGASAAVVVRGAAPLRLLVPRPRGLAVWGWAASLGGGLVSGDALHLDVAVGADARCYLGTQASTKVYRQGRHAGAHQTVRATVAAGGLLALLPEHLTAFRDARLTQVTDVDVTAGGSAVVLDWYSAGRPAHRADEVWAARHLSTQVRLTVDGALRLHDHTVLAPAPGLPSVAQRMGRVRVVASLAAVGPLTAPLRAWLGAHPAPPTRAGQPVVESLAPLGAEGVLWRLAGEAVAPVAQRLRAATASLGEVLGGDPNRAQLG